MRRSCALAVLAAFVIAAPAHAVLIPNTGATFGSTDANWSVLWRPTGLFDGSTVGFAPQAALITSPPVPPWQPPILGVNNWIGVNSAASIGTVPDGNRRFEYAFTASINLPVAQTVTGAIGWDNFFVGGFFDGSLDATTGTYTAGTQFASPTSLLGAGNENKAGFCRDSDGILPSSSFPVCTINFSFELPAGAHTITFVIQGDGVTDAFFLNQAGISLVSEPASLALLAAALVGFGFGRRKRAN